jgi:hypothetical protein
VETLSNTNIMKLPNGEHAVIPVEKLKGYCLNPDHPSGKNKARVFASAIGVTLENFEDLRELIKRASVEGEVVQQNNTNFGQQIKIDWPISGYDQVILRTLWEINVRSPNPRLVSAFIK